MKKRAYCLYRVSTKGQVEKDDIPMQRQTCREFAEKMNWDIIEEYTEKGVSGFKVSAKDRDAIQDLQRDAALGKFDVLLVFMFDRLGRKEDETPFVVEWFVNNGVEVWSAMEGQQKFDTHVDKLMNYIRYWQASGESIKTSIRTKTRLGQIVQEGKFRGGVAPYGYDLIKKGRVGKKNRELYDLEINEAEAAVVRKIFDLCIKHGYGGRRIASTLQEEGILNRSGELFHYSSIQNILKNIMYTGVLRSGETFSDIFPEFQIIDVDIFEHANDIIKQRSNDYDEYRTVPRTTIGRALLSGNIYCGHCGGRVFASTAKKGHSNNERVPIYKCYNRTQYYGACDGPTTYRAQKVDNAIKEMLSEIFMRIRNADEGQILSASFEDEIKDLKARHKMAKQLVETKTKELARLDEMMLDAVDGTNGFTPERLMRRMDAVEQELNKASFDTAQIDAQIKEGAMIYEEIRKEHSAMVSWADVFMDATPEMQKMIATSMIKAVRIKRDYELDVEYNFNEQQYQMGLSF